MKHEIITEEVKRIQEIMENSQKIQEGFHLDTEYEPENDTFEPQPAEEEAPVVDNQEIVSLVNQIRKMALNGMSKFSDMPDSNEYQTLKKVWQICEKKPEKAGINPTKEV